LFACCVNDLRLIAEEAERGRALGDQRESHTELDGIRCACLFGKLLELVAVPGLVCAGAFSSFGAAGFELGGSAYEAATAKAFACDPFELPLDGGLQALYRWRGRSRERVDQRLSAVVVALGQGRVDQARLGLEVPVNRRLADARCVGDRIHAGRSDAVLIEQAAGSSKERRVNLRGLRPSHSYTLLDRSVTECAMLVPVPRDFPRLRHPIIQAPLAGGPSTPALAAAVSDAGGLGFLAAGYKAPEGLRADISTLRELTSERFGVNLFLLTAAPVEEVALAAFAEAVHGEEARNSARLGRPRFDDDAFDAKLEIVLAEQPPVVSFTFGCPSREIVDALHDREIAVWVTITDPEEAREATDAGADAVIAQGVEAGGHRGCFDDLDGHGELSLLPLLRLTAHATSLPLVASGGIADGAGVAAALAAGARAVQIGTGFMRCPEAATSPAHREALAQPGATALTRAFTGRRARGIINQFMRDYGPLAPSAYPHIHHLTAPLRAAARNAQDPDRINLWAGETHILAPQQPAADLVRRWSHDAQTALAQAAHSWPHP
jgi:nitronate monooxygenase